MKGYCGVGGGITKGLLGLSDSHREALYWSVCVPTRIVIIPSLIRKYGTRSILTDPWIWACIAQFTSYRLQLIDWDQRNLTQQVPGVIRPSLFNPTAYTFICEARAAHARLAQLVMPIFAIMALSRNSFDTVTIGIAWIVLDALLGIYWQFHS